MEQQPPKEPYSTPESQPPHYEKSPTGEYMGPAPDNNARQWGMLSHLLGLVIGLLTALGFVGPLIVLLTKKDEHPFIEDQANETLNFQITILIYYLIAGAITAVTCFIASPVLLVPWLMQLILGIIGTVNANKGIAYRYPMTIRLIS
ncbi:MAG: DUF4870 domain-containing protein [Planctomycetes bacterium]|nr:DUF4870 domain-containing protein [Planctomycetota bacterium]